VAEAKQILTAAGFTNIVFNGDSSDTAFVIDQDPKPDKKTNDPAGTQITLTTFGAQQNGGNNGNGGGGDGFIGGLD
jgi:serine/threonine-protein kinase